MCIAIVSLMAAQRDAPFAEAQAALQGPVPSLRYAGYSETNPVGYQDRAGFEGYALQYAEETKGMADLEQIEVRGEELCSTLYTYRSIARALPTVGGDDAHKRAMYSASFEVLHPQISRVKMLMYFKDEAVSKFCASLSLLVRVETRKRAEDGKIPCEGLMIQLLRVLDCMVVLDSLKDTKACLNNDFSTYKRAFRHCRNDVPNAEQVAQENTLLQPFLANKEALLTQLKVAVHEVPGCDDVLVAMANLSIECLEQQLYLLPQEKHQLVRGAAYLLWLVDKKGGPNAFHHKRLKKERFGRQFKRTPIVPLYGDMHASLQLVLQRCPNFNTVSPGDLLPISRRDAEAVANEYQLRNHLPHLRLETTDYIAELTALLHHVAACGGGAKCALKRDAHTALAQTLTDCALRGCRLMCVMSALLSEFVAWKCAHMADAAALAMRAARDADVCDYERALRYNLDARDRTALVELLGMLQGLHRALHKVEGDPEILIRRAMHEQCQHFIHSVMGGPTRKAVKYEKKALKAQLMLLRNMCADWAGGVAIMTEDRIKSKEFKHESHDHDYPPRSLPPSPTQLWLMRCSVRALYDERAAHMGKGGILSDPDLPKETIRDMKSFYAASALYPHLLQLPTTLGALASTSFLWMREFYLELCARPQFPISMSLPWILTEHVLNARNTPSMAFLFAPVGVYNDAGMTALSKHRQQYLFTEIEAEVNLCFDQILYALSEQVYTHFKVRASSMLLENRRNARDVDGNPDRTAAQSIGRSWYARLLRHRHLRVLGRSVDISRLLTQRMNGMTRKSLDLAISRFEAADLPAVLELDLAIRAARSAHGMLAEHLPELDDFDAVLAEMEERVGFLSFTSRILEKVLTEVLDDLLPNFAFRYDGQLFQRPPPTSFTPPLERDAPPKVGTNFNLLFGTKQLNAEFAMRAVSSQAFFGAAHAEALVGLLGDAGMQARAAPIAALSLRLALPPTKPLP